MPKRNLTTSSIWDVDALRAHMSEYHVKPVHLRSLWKLAFAAQSLPEVCEKLSQVKSPPPTKWIQALQRDFTLCSTTVIGRETKNAAAGCKLVLQTQDSLIFEAVIMKQGDTQDPDKGSGRVTLCVSSQVGCKMGCTFCETGTLGHLGNLSAGEIAEQLYHAQRWVGAGTLGETKVRNIVFMGMGEPLDNYSAVASAVEAMMCDVSFGILGRHITISTVGVVSKIQQLAVDPRLRQVNLAVSLHAATQDTRLRIVPSAKGFPIDKLIEAMSEYCRQTEKGIMIEYIVLSGVNDCESDASELARLLDGLNCWLNLIPYNPTSIGESNGFSQPSNESLRSFEQCIRKCKCKNHLGDPLSIRTRFSTQSGQDADSACGQLAAAAAMKVLASQQNSVKDVEDLVIDSSQRVRKGYEHAKPTTIPLIARYRCEVLLCAGVMAGFLAFHRWRQGAK
eukprot:TRINITY_DN54794_c0_g1_i1.p1 TRINITY_DN54794_c0_g1~~TRINITY_DN54794_c0_g1_i1.p1  ORF type:complete len:450 (+),score=38.48 TRINITY_DN54794_c0_g1_i1:116-1465(+)